jgi:Diacylglycerol acyltransferase
MEVEQVKNPTDEEVDAVHKRYIDHLNQLFETHKATYGISPDKHLSFI